jgi:hypothetical protein
MKISQALANNTGVSDDIICIPITKYSHVFIRLHDFLDAGKWQLVVLKQIGVFRHSKDFLLYFVHLLSQLPISAVGELFPIGRLDRRGQVSCVQLLHFRSSFLLHLSGINSKL